MKHTYPHAKPEMKKFNVSYNRGYKGISLGKAVSQRIEKGYTGEKAIRKDSVKFLSLILSEQMNKLGKFRKNHQDCF